MASQLKKIEEHLAPKRRTAHDLIQFIKTRTDAVSNYTLLLGAGASVTSGIRSASTLVDEWRQDLYLRLCPEADLPYCDTKAREWLQKYHADWYSQQREYASLFEKKFDLPRQRRMFVENEVAGKHPSIGYSYLIRLIEDNYFNAIFTTNFDDLLNEAFHQFASLRPIVCAHDSSISSITVTSKRPKIIKLHGDYLFDDIKSTVKETESLEDNTKKKFVEFSKEHGLIVIGYSGHDRSIMEVLHHLLKQDDYLKHGIYWCMRRGDTPSDELIKLLWKDRAYWVEIEGFDELMADLYGECIGDTLPISTGLVAQRPKEVINRFCNDEYLRTSKSAVIQRDLKKLRRELDREALVSSLRTVARIDRSDEEDATPTDLKDRELITLMEIRQHREDKEFLRSLERISIELKQTDNLEYRSQLLLIRLSIEEETRDYSQALKSCEELISDDPNNAYYHLRRANNLRTHDKRLKAIADALAIDPFYPRALMARAELFEEQIGELPDSEIDVVNASVLNDYNSSLSMNPSIDNTAWSAYVDFLDGSTLPDAGHMIDIALQNLKKQDAYHSTYLKLAIKQAAKQSVTTRLELIEHLKNAIKSKSRNLKKRTQLIYFDALKQFRMNTELLDELLACDSETRWTQDKIYIDFRARVYAEVEGKLFEAIRILKSYKGIKRDRNLLKTLISYLCYASEIAEAQSLVEECKEVLGPSSYDNIQQDIFSLRNEHEKALSVIRRRKELAIFHGRFVVLETHALLKLNRFEEAERLARSVLEPVHFSFRFDPLIINLELATSRYNRHKVDKPRLTRIAQSSKSGDLTRMCAYLLLEDEAKAGERLVNAIEKDKTDAYSIRDWAIFDAPKYRKWLSDFLKTHGLENEIAAATIAKTGS